MKRKSLLSGAMLLCLAGCVPVTVNPFITPERGGVDERLVGDWVNDEELNWRIETRPGGYLIHQRMIADSSHARYVVLYEATTTTLDGWLLLDIHLRRAGGVDGLMWYHVVPGHTLSRIDAVGVTLRLAMFDNRWLKKQLDSGALVTPHFLLPPADEHSYPRLVLTGDTATLWQLARDVVDSTSAFDVEIEFVRQ